MLQEILCNTQLQNTRTDTRYFRYYPCRMRILIFPLKHLGNKCVIYTARCSNSVADFQPMSLFN